jgi:hypothetical protein
MSRMLLPGVIYLLRSPGYFCLIKTWNMDAKAVKEKILNGLMSDEELAGLMAGHQPRKRSLVNTILKGVNDSYIVPTMQKVLLESILILAIVIGAVILSYNGKLDMPVTAALLAAVLGYLFGKIK